ncbi:nucleotidyltransferase family protein [uncultured Thiothrix sp.]|uniref:nucleotidyltransferase family protein n=1 Tax=uncultured Thiothrix sp. TaxID=223185 RepID=UPI0026278CC7|nr:nucleotidyltransferase family protein [uncultured Thiothrix sp.]
MTKVYGKELTAVLLAAGQSRRFGSAKLLHKLANRMPLGLLAAQKLQAVFEQVLVVVNHESAELNQLYQNLGVEVVVNLQADQGLGASLATGIAHSADSEGWLISLADMPFIQTETLQTLATALKHGALIAAPTYEGKRGHPVGFAQALKAELLQLNQDIGASQLLKRYADQLLLLPTQDAGILQDIDTPEDLTRLASLI